MCIHTLRFYHPDCPHQSLVPTIGPNYIPPRKCAFVLEALDFYHTQPSRAPEMYPPPCPSPCLPVWGNESCRGNVLCAFRAGKCDGCMREDELVGMAKWLVEQIRNGWVKGASAVERHLKVVELWRPKSDGEHERAERMLGEVRELVGDDDGGKIFGDEALRAVVRNVVKGRGQVDEEQKEMVAFWMVFQRRLGKKLTYGEFKRLQSFLDGTQASDESGPTTGIKANDGKSRDEPANRSRGQSDLPLAGETPKRAGRPPSKSTPITPSPFINKTVGIDKADTGSPPSSTIDNDQINQKESEPKAPSTRLQTDKLLARVRRSLSLADQAQAPTSPIISSPTLTAPVKVDSRTSPSPCRSRRKSRDHQYRGPSAQQSPRRPSLNRENASLGSPGAENAETHGDICYEHHEVGYSGPEQKEVPVQAWMNGVDGPKWEDIMDRATEVSREIWGKLKDGDTREDWCGAGKGSHRDEDGGPKE